MGGRGSRLHGQYAIRNRFPQLAEIINGIFDEKKLVPPIVGHIVGKRLGYTNNNTFAKWLDGFRKGYLTGSEYSASVKNPAKTADHAGAFLYAIGIPPEDKLIASLRAHFGEGAPFPYPPRDPITPQDFYREHGELAKQGRPPAHAALHGP